MEVLSLKLLLLAFMFLVALAFGLLPLKLYSHLTRRKGRIGRNSSFAISLLSCFCGGVIIGVCLLELLPEAHEALEAVEEQANWQSGYPYVELFTGIGLFVVYLVEELLSTCLGLKHDHNDEGAHDAFSNVERPKAPSNCSTAKTDVEDDAEAGTRAATPATSASLPPPLDEQLGHDPHISTKADQRRALINACTFVLALIFHTSLEGFAFGVQTELMSVSSLFFGIITHKALVAFSVGMSLARALSHSKKWVVGLVVMLALFSPLGGIIGICVQSTGTESVTKLVISTILTCFSIGTFIFIAFFEILAPERNAGHPKLAQWVACVLGFCLMAGFLTIGAEGEHHSS